MGSASNKAETLGMENVKGMEVYRAKNRLEVNQLTNLASLGASQAKTKAWLGMHARLSWGWRDMLGSMDRKHG